MSKREEAIELLQRVVALSKNSSCVRCGESSCVCRKVILNEVLASGHFAERALALLQEPEQEADIAVTCPACQGSRFEKPSLLGIVCKRCNGEGRLKPEQPEAAELKKGNE
jgi:hypothetical protein